MEELKKYQSTISIERLRSFIRRGETDVDVRVLLERYKDNILMSQAFYPVLSILEITLRNAIDTMLKTYIGEDWIEKELQQQNILQDYELNKLKEACIVAKQSSKSSALSHGKIVENLTFGFWTNLCLKRYGNKIWTKPGRFRAVFVNFPQCQREQVHSISTKLTAIKRLRNKVYHYAPVLRSREKMLAMYNDMIEILSYLPSDDADILKKTCNFLQVCQTCKSSLQITRNP